jgi:hypothetical protein
MENKLCTKCYQMLPTENFGKQPHNTGGFKSYCKPCTTAYMRQYRRQKGQGLLDREREQARNYKIKKENPEVLIARLNRAIERCQIAGVEIPQPMPVPI